MPLRIDIFALVLAFLFAFATALVLALAFLLFVMVLRSLPRNPLELHPVCFSVLVRFHLAADVKRHQKVVGLLIRAVVQAAAYQVFTNLSNNFIAV